MKLSIKIRIKDDSAFSILSEMADAMSQTERSLYRHMLVDPEYAGYKSDFSKLHGVTSRQFNSLRMSVEGRLEARKSSLEREHDKVAAKLTSAIKIITNIEKERKDGIKTKQNDFVLHQKKRLRYKLELRIKDLAVDISDGARRLCFGGRKLFNAQHHLKENGFTDHAQVARRLAGRQKQPVHGGRICERILWQSVLPTRHGCRRQRVFKPKDSQTRWKHKQGILTLKSRYK
jgi:hypothetical protein